MDEYTYDNIIIDPTKEGIENLIGKEVYIADVPKYCLRHANKNESDYLAVLIAIRKDDVYPFLVKRKSVNYEETRSCIIVKKEPCCEDQVKQWIKENNLKVGDYVKVTRRAENHADGLDDYWYNLMRDSVGKILKVKEISNFIMLDNGINYPYFVLEKAEKPEPKCVPFSNAKEFFNYYLSTESRLEKEDYFLSNHGIWLKAKYADDALFMVTEIWSYGVVFSCDMKTTEELEGKYLTINEVTTWEQLLKRYTFLDGSPCGKEVKDL